MKIKTVHKNRIVEAICILYALLFFYAAINKLMDYQKFQVQLGQSPLLSVYADWVAILVPVLEIIIALLLFYKPLRTIALYCSCFLMVMFTTYIVIILNFSSFVPCSCGGVLEKLGWTEHLIFNIGFVVLGVIAILLESHKKNDTEVEPAKYQAI